MGENTSIDNININTITEKQAKDLLPALIDKKQTLSINSGEYYDSVKKQIEKYEQLIKYIQNNFPNLKDTTQESDYALGNRVTKGGSKKVKFIKKGKTYSRTIKVNKRGTKYVRFDGKDIPISRLKLSG